jgi:hypothetical protein
MVAARPQETRAASIPCRLKSRFVPSGRVRNPPRDQKSSLGHDWPSVLRLWKDALRNGEPLLRAPSTAATRAQA